MRNLADIFYQVECQAEVTVLVSELNQQPEV